ncbi:hypothetical protein [Curtobacterium sp. MCBD17_019]|uniref:hypothetical protein n=1 Tax=Curtobacterium sp. MCBD17_019 TaxID=2175669 RepID=UPI0015E87CAE|nr:hypothetical protein [Curtobacterium sp. MCBD17_019]
MTKTVGLLAKSASPPISPSIAEQMKVLPRLAAEYSDMDLMQDAERILIPGKVAAALATLIKAAVQDENRNRDGVASMLTDDANRSHYAVSRWIQANNFFVKWAHIHVKLDVHESVPTDIEIANHIEIFEELMDGVATAFFDRRRTVQNLLADINATDEVDDA